MLSVFKIPVSPAEFAKVQEAILLGVCMSFRYQPRMESPLLSLSDDPVGRARLTGHLGENNKVIRLLFKRDIIKAPYVILCWSKYVEQTD